MASLVGRRARLYGATARVGPGIMSVLSATCGWSPPAINPRRFLRPHREFAVRRISDLTSTAPSGPGALTLQGTGAPACGLRRVPRRSEEHTSELQSRENLVCRLLLEKKKKNTSNNPTDTTIKKLESANH